MGRPQHAGRDVLTDGARPAAPAHTAPRRAVSGPLRVAGPRARTAVAVVVVAMLAALTSLRWIDAPTPTWLPTLQAVVPLALAPAVIVLILAAHTRRRAVAVAAGAVIAVHVALAAPWWIPGDHAADARRREPIGRARHQRPVRLQLPRHPAPGRGVAALADLDHVLLRDIDVAAFDRFPMPGTDHHAVTATLLPRRGQASAPPGRRASRS